MESLELESCSRLQISIVITGLMTLALHAGCCRHGHSKGSKLAGHAYLALSRVIVVVSQEFHSWQAGIEWVTTARLKFERQPRNC